MELQLDNGEYQVVFRDSNLNVTIEESAPLNVVVGESARIEVGEAINYIQSGTQEIAEAVQEGIASFDSNAQEKTSEFNANYTEKKALIDAQVDIAEEQANIATSQAQTATVQAGIATTKAGEATTSASNASLSETNASQSATTATTQAGIATTKAGEASISASNALASETSASNSALSASSSANLAKQWAIGDPSEPAGNSAKYWAGQSQAELSGLTSRVSTIEGKIPSSASSSNQLVDKNYVDTEDNNLQTQIDAIVSSSDVFDIVGTYAELQAYDITTVPVNDIVKVLVDSTHGGAATYYRCIETAGVKSWSYIGSEGAYYTKGEADSKFSTIPATGSSLDYTGTTLSLENAQGTVLSSVTIKSTPDLDNTSITLNGSSQLQTVGVINSRDSSTAVKTWTGTKAQYDDIVTKDPNTEYFCTDSGELYLGDVKIGSDSGLKVGDIGQSALGIDESLNERRYLNGQVISQTQFAQFTAWLKQRVSIYPSLATSEADWQTAVTNSDLGQCGQFVIDDINSTIRLPKVVNLQGLQDLTHLGETVEAGLPNITGDLWGQGLWNADRLSGAFYGNGTGRNADYNDSGAMTASFDASLSNSIYGNSSTVQPESIQYPYFIQVAEGIENSVDVSREIELNNPFDLLNYKFSEYEISNASWLRSNGQWNSGAVYQSAYELLLQIYNGTVTKAGVSVKLSTETYEDTDFVLNTSDTTFRLPLKVALASGKAVVGNGMTLGLTDGTHEYGFTTELNVSGDVLNYAPINSALGISATGSMSKKSTGITLDPTKSGIETSANGLYLYFYVGAVVQDASVIAAASVLTDIANLKAGYSFFPDYANGENLAVNTTYIADKPYFVTQKASGSVATFLTINGEQLDNNNNGSTSLVGWYIYTGDIYKTGPNGAYKRYPLRKIF